MRIYLDNCTLQRPRDDHSQPRVAVEAEAVLQVLAAIEAGHVDLIASGVLYFENRKTPDPIRQAEGLRIIQMAKTYVTLDDNIVNRTETFERGGLKPLDALHLASAVEAGASFFCTCDDQLLRRGRALLEPNTITRLVSPVELLSELNL